MATIAEKYEKFLITDELKESFSVEGYQYSEKHAQVEVKIVQKKNTANGVIFAELDDAKLVWTFNRIKRFR